MTRPPRPRIHLLRVLEPIANYKGLRMLCGMELRNAIPVYMNDTEATGRVFPCARECGSCNQWASKSPLLRYEYGLVDAELERESDAE